MSHSSKIALIKEMLESAESSLRSAKQILLEMSSENGKIQYDNITKRLDNTEDYDESEQVIEGVFDGQKMIGPDQKEYSVPANYASKSKLIPGDVLKLNISEDGSFLYKQIGPIERKRVIGTLTYDNGQYRVIAESKSYKVLLASVTYFRAEIGDKITLIVPELEDSEWGAIENVLPKSESDSDLSELGL